ncbi:hypothetical protein MLD38_039520 [Melastoma candidum]|uniref:Uncharacterized protein n=1 Tax=Melastoma candidum TaxID=119954 RepID=A0ACB9L4P1_9MYRT|nr:hypothetical protein MLD38_039520 [Melastoma candidum]
MKKLGMKQKMKMKKKMVTEDNGEEEGARLLGRGSLSWTPSLSADDADSSFPFLTTGSNELDGGFLSLEEIDEAEYGLDIPEPVKQKSRRKRKKREESEDGVENEAGGPLVEEQQQETVTGKDVGRKNKRRKKKQKTEAPEINESAAEISNGGDAVEEEQFDDPEFRAWDVLRLHPIIMKSIYKLGFKEPTPIQKACIPAAAHQGKDVIGAAETGSGKTLAFGLPIFQRLLEEREKVERMLDNKGEEAEKYAPTGVLRALIITPTRELALQVTDHLKKVASIAKIRVVPIVGGISSEKQERLLKARPEIVVGTPGRLWELMSNGEIHLIELHSLSFFVLDEADRMIENGHFHELQGIIDKLPTADQSAEENQKNMQSCVTVSNIQRKKRQTLVFSATIALSGDFRKKLKRGAVKSKQSMNNEFDSIEALSERAGMRPNAAIIDLTNASILAQNLEESFLECREEDKDAYLYYILTAHGQGRTIVFCTSVAALRHLSSLVRILGVKIWTLHAQMHQRARLKAIDHFRGSKHGVLVATDVAARGLDIPGVQTVIHYQLPHSAEVYVHRSGRTARASAEGCSIALISPNEASKFASLCRSFSKDSFQRFPIEDSYMPEIMKRVSLARQIDKISRKDSQEKAQKSWLERHAESLELDVENSDSEEERVNAFKKKKAITNQLTKLQQELKMHLSRPLQPKTLSRRFLAGAGVSSLLQQQFEALARSSGEKSKLVVIGQDSMEPLQALRSAGQEVRMDGNDMAGKRKSLVLLKRKRKEEKRRLRDQRRKQRRKPRED